jgi:hypothetical protein
MFAAKLQKKQVSHKISSAKPAFRSAKSEAVFT